MAVGNAGEDASVDVATKYRWEIPNFSHLSGMIDSADFFSSGCKWRLSILPEGEGGEYLSIAISVADWEDLPDGWERDVKYTISVISHSKKSASLALTESECKFNAETVGCGYRSLITLSMLLDPAEGYLLHDTLTVEAVVRVISALYKSKGSETAEAAHSITEVHHKEDFENIIDGIPTRVWWDIRNFSQISEVKVESGDFFASGCKWRLGIYPKGQGGQYLSVYLLVPDWKDLPDGWERVAKYSISVSKHSDKTASVSTRESEHTFKANAVVTGYRNLILRSKLLDPAQSYLRDDILSVEAVVSVVSALHKSKTPSAHTALQDFETVVHHEGAQLETTYENILSRVSTLRSNLKPIGIADSVQEEDQRRRQRKEELRGYLRMSFKALQEANLFDQIEAILRELAQQTENEQERNAYEAMVSGLTGFRGDIQGEKATEQTYEAELLYLAEKSEAISSKLLEREKMIASLELEVSKLTGKEDELRAEIEMVLARKQSVEARLVMESEQTIKEVVEGESLLSLRNKVNSTLNEVKQRLAATEVRWDGLRLGWGLGIHE